jgi:hypothetical protein
MTQPYSVGIPQEQLIVVVPEGVPPGGQIIVATPQGTAHRLLEIFTQIFPCDNILGPRILPSCPGPP